ncbi:MAG: RNA polymerase sigma factor [Pirellulaceae bacterium]
MSDADLVRQAQQGDAASYGELVRRWSARIVGFCHAKVGAAPAEDLAQETLLRGFRAVATLSDPDRFGAWLRGIATRVCLDWLKSKGRRDARFQAIDGDGRFETLAADARLSPGEQAEVNDELAQLMCEVERLPEQYREVLMIYYYDEPTYKELAAMLEVSPATVNARLTKARQLLRRRLSGVQP